MKKSPFRWEEMMGSVFNVHGANEFNSFISNAGLVEIQLEGYSFTWSHPSAAKMSKLDRFLVSEGFFFFFSRIFKLYVLVKNMSVHRSDFASTAGIHLFLEDSNDIKSTVVRDQMQKAKIQWAVEGDENSKFFHGIVNRKRVHLSVKGVMVDGEWVDEPNRVKDEVQSRLTADQIF
ncbi:hypothetical protein Tco_1321336 [Tanacetum coccineum]